MFGVLLTCGNETVTNRLCACIDAVVNMKTPEVLIIPGYSRTGYDEECTAVSAKLALYSE